MVQNWQRWFCFKETKSIDKMSFAMDKALMALSLEEEDEPFQMPNLPQYKSTERNARSLIGRILNPDCQKMAGLIHDMPRKWQKQGKVRGVALSKERFQFIFDHEHDLLEVLEKGVHTFNDWTIVIDRWVEKPPEDYLRYILVWVQIRNLPINYYTREAITELGELLGQVKVVAFDPDRPQAQDYVRIQVKFDVSRPLRKSKVVDLPEGGSTVVLFNYERIQKRCYECQRLNHEKDVCPLLVKKRKEAAVARGNNRLRDDARGLVCSLHREDPLFGILSEDQVGINKSTGRRKISEEVLEEMRKYMMMATDEDRLVRAERVRSSVAEVEKDPISRKTILRLESAPLFTTQVDKGKGIVFDFDLNKALEPRAGDGEKGEKLMASAFGARKELETAQFLENLSLSKDRRTDWKQTSSASSSRGFEAFNDSNKQPDLVFNVGRSSTEHGSVSADIKLSGASQKLSKQRRRPYIRKRQMQERTSAGILQELYGKDEGCEKSGSKRKKVGEEGSSQNASKRKESRVVPNQGPPNS